MTLYLGSMILVGILGALLLALLHRANERQTARAISGVVRQNAPKTAMTHSEAFYAVGARPGVTAGAWGHPDVSSQPMVDGEYRRYGSDLPRIERGRVTTRQYRRNRLGPGVGAGALEITHTTPHREPNAGSDLLVPLGQAVVSAVVAALLAGVLAAVAGRGDTLRVVAVSFVGVLALAWLWRLGVVDSLLSVVERVTQELDDAEPEADDPSHAMTIQAGAARADAGRKERARERALRLADLLAFAQRCATVGCSERSQGIRAGTPQQEAYRVKRDLLLTLGIGKWKNPENHNLGWVLTVDAAEAAELLRHHVMDVSA